MTRIQTSYKQLRTMGYPKAHARHTVERMVKAHVLGVSADVTKTTTWRPNGNSKLEVIKYHHIIVTAYIIVKRPDLAWL